jgi:hypothetical protein
MRQEKRRKRDNKSCFLGFWVTESERERVEALWPAKARFRSAFLRDVLSAYLDAHQAAAGTGNNEGASDG